MNMKALKNALVTCALVVSFINPARSAVGLSFAAPAAVVAGVAILAVSAGGAYGGYRLIKVGKTGLGIGALAVTAVGGYFGFIILDGEQEAKFAELSPEGADALGISAAEVAVYNSEIEQVNAIAREIGSELVKQNSDSPELARDMWADLGTELSPETMKTVIAIAQQG
jgi:hypothetical protein